MEGAPSRRTSPLITQVHTPTDSIRPMRCLLMHKQNAALSHGQIQHFLCGHLLISNSGPDPNFRMMFQKSTVMHSWNDLQTSVLLGCLSKRNPNCQDKVRICLIPCYSSILVPWRNVGASVPPVSNPQVVSRICWMGLQMISVPTMEVTIFIRFLLHKKTKEALPRKCIMSSSE